MVYFLSKCAPICRHFMNYGSFRRRIDDYFFHFFPFLTVKYENISLGCGHWNGEILKNQIPKSKFCKINFL